MISNDGFVLPLVKNDKARFSFLIKKSWTLKNVLVKSVFLSVVSENDSNFLTFFVRNILDSSFMLKNC